MDKKTLKEFETLRWETLEAFYRKEGEPTEWKKLYLGEPWTDSFSVDEECWYLDRRGPLAARVMSYDRENVRYGKSPYLIEYVSYRGYVERRWVGAGELRKAKRSGENGPEKKFDMGSF